MQTFFSKSSIWADRFLLFSFALLMSFSYLSCADAALASDAVADLSNLSICALNSLMILCCFNILISFSPIALICSSTFVVMLTSNPSILFFNLSISSVNFLFFDSSLSAFFCSFSAINFVFNASVYFLKFSAFDLSNSLIFEFKFSISDCFCLIVATASCCLLLSADNSLLICLISASFSLPFFSNSVQVFFFDSNSSWILRPSFIIFAFSCVTLLTSFCNISKVFWSHCAIEHANIACQVASSFIARHCFWTISRFIKFLPNTKPITWWKSMAQNTFQLFGTLSLCIIS